MSFQSMTHFHLPIKSPNFVVTILGRSVDIDTFPTNISLEESTDICIKELSSERKTIQNLRENDWRELLTPNWEFEIELKKSIEPFCHRTYQIPGRYFLKMGNDSILKINMSVHTCSHFKTLYLVCFLVRSTIKLLRNKLIKT